MTKPPKLEYTWPGALVPPTSTNWDIPLGYALLGFIVGTVTGIYFLDSPWWKDELSLGLLGAFVGFVIGFMDSGVEEY